MYIKVRVTPGQRKESFEMVAPDHVRISVKEKAKGGQANDRVRELLAEQFRVPLSHVRLLSGHTSPSKLFDIRNA